jgi:hypothetical protein
MGRFTVIVDDELDTKFRIEAVKKRVRLNRAFEEAMRLWLEKVGKEQE